MKWKMQNLVEKPLRKSQKAYLVHTNSKIHNDLKSLVSTWVILNWKRPLCFLCCTLSLRGERTTISRNKRFTVWWIPSGKTIQNRFFSQTVLKTERKGNTTENANNPRIKKFKTRNGGQTFKNSKEHFAKLHPNRMFYEQKANLILFTGSNKVPASN